MGSVNYKNERFLFRVYGGDEHTAGFLKKITVIYWAIIVLGIFFVVPEGKHYGIIIFVVIASSVLLFAVFLKSVINGAFARYNIVIDGRTIKAFDTKTGNEIFNNTFDPHFLHVVNTLVKRGILYKYQKDLVYSKETPENAEEKEPHPDFCVLCAGPEYELLKVQNELIKLYKTRNI